MSARFRRCFAVFLIVLSEVVAAPFAYAETTYSFNLPEQALADSLRAIGQQTDMNILFEPEAVKNARSPAIKGQYTVDEAIRLVLIGTKLEAQHTAASNVVIKLRSARSTVLPPTSADTPGSSAARLAQSNSGSPQSQSAAGPQNTDTSNSTSEPSKREGLSEIVVTGTLIHDVAPITPVTTITHDEILNQGYSTLGQVFDQLPENFNGNGSTPASSPLTRQGTDTVYNNTYASGVNLLGLGSDATLVLVNGRRQATNAYGITTDVSSIPVSIIDRVEILTDGASALYGSDAVAGVVNIITRRDFDGVEVGARAYNVSEGKSPNWGEYGLAGYSWGTGNFVFNVDHESQFPLYARDRDFTSFLPDPTLLYPKNESNSYYASVQNAFTDRFSFSADGSFSRRSYDAQSISALAQLPDINYGTVDQYNVSLEGDYKLSPTWRAVVIGQGSRENDNTFDQNLQYGTYISNLQFENRVYSVDARADGALFKLPGGDVHLALGGELMHENWISLLPETPAFTSSRRVGSAYGELMVPIIGSENSMVFTKGLRFDVSARYDNYSDFGGTTNPKIAVEWIPVGGIKVHASASRSFQAPTLFQTSNYFDYGYIYTVPDPTKGPNGATKTLLLDGTNPNLQPETAKNFKVGIVFEPEQAKGLRFDLAYFHTDFRSRITELFSQNFFANVLQDAAQLGPLVERNPSLAEIEQQLSYPGRITNDLDNNGCIVGTPGRSGSPASIGAIANIGYVNAGVVKVGGANIHSTYTGPVTSYGRWHADLSGIFYTTYQEQITPTSSQFNLVNTVYNPLKFRAKTNVGWDHAGFGANLRLNYANSYQNGNAANTACPGAPNCSISSWTTLDLGVSYTSPPGRFTSILSGVRFGIDVTNLFNKAPPVVSTTANSGLTTLPYDGVNANPFLRMVSISFTKQFSLAH